MHKIHSIFPFPVYQTNIKQDITEHNIDYIKNQKQKSTKNEGNFTSLETYLLNKEQLKPLEKHLMVHVNNYFKEVIQASNKVTPYITQSWVNFTALDENHHFHSHSNSIASGVLYIAADKKHDLITFHKVNRDQIELKVKEFNPYNSGSWRFEVDQGDLFIFPSTLAHSVPRKHDNNLRISLAFNVFVKGVLGRSGDLNELSVP
tara:strand:+ start:298 stop:909 length:612 start_codon:yes stop_codon:yes gene_type:complete